MPVCADRHSSQPSLGDDHLLRFCRGDRATLPWLERILRSSRRFMFAPSKASLLARKQTDQHLIERDTFLLMLGGNLAQRVAALDLVGIPASAGGVSACSAAPSVLQTVGLRFCNRCARLCGRRYQQGRGRWFHQPFFRGCRCDGCRYRCRGLRGDFGRVQWEGYTPRTGRPGDQLISSNMSTNSGSFRGTIRRQS